MGQIALLPGKQEAESIETSPIVTPAAIREPVNTIRPVIPSPVERQEKIEISSPNSGYEENRQSDLLNHPNYQEQSANNGNRRRRRSRRNDLLIKEELIEQDATSTDDDRESEDNGEERKLRSQSRSPRRDEINLEKVTVEMDELEQEIYALMGVSPLVYANEGVKKKKILDRFWCMSNSQEKS